MKLTRIHLGAGLSAVSWRFIEGFALAALFFLPFSKSISEVTVIVALVLWILRKFPWDEPFPAIRGAFWAYAVFYGLTLLSLFQIPQADLWTGLHGTVKWLKWLGILFMSYELCRDKERAGRLTCVFIASVTLLCINGFFQSWTGADLVKRFSADMPGPYARIQSSLDSPNNLACFLLFALPLLFWKWLKENKWSPKSLAYVFLLGLAFFTFIGTHSRSGIFALTIAAGVYLLMEKRWKLFLVAAGAGLLAFSGYAFDSARSLTLQDVTIGERLRFWRVGWDMVLANPWLGHGVNTFYKEFGRFAPATESYRGYAHNCYLQMWAEVGIAGLLAFLWPLRLALQRAISGRGAALGVGIIAYLIQSAGDTNFYAHQTAILFWFLWGTFLAERQNA